METIDTLRDKLPDFARDIRLNIQGVLSESSLSAPQLWGVAVASAAAGRNPTLTQTILDEARKHVDAAVVDDALASAALMAMNNVYYRFRHLVGKESYSQKPARLRMNRIGRPATNKVDFELFCLAVSAINGCEACIQAHEKVVLEGGLSEDQIHDAVRVAATMHAAAVSLELST